MRRPTRIVIACLLGSLVLLAGCSSTGSTPAASNGSGPGPKSVAVSLKGMAIVPSDITVGVGGTVTFTNNDSVEHNIAGDGWASGPMAAGATYSQAFPTAGTFPIHCTIHPSMTGSITVR